MLLLAKASERQQNVDILLYDGKTESLIYSIMPQTATAYKAESLLTLSC